MTMTSKFNYVTYDVNEKYLLIAFLRAADIPFNVSGYYFNSEGTDKLFDWHMNRAVASLNSIIDPNSSIIPLCILSEED